MRRPGLSSRAFALPRSLSGMSSQVDESVVLVEGPWTHRFVGANGSRFHVVEAGTGPLVLFLTVFPEFWWAWHDIMTGVADAGFRAVAIDLRGYGASDKPPRGYDGYTMAADVTGLIRALGERSATIVGAGAGGMIGWAAAAFHPKMVDRLVVLGAAHPLRLGPPLRTRAPDGRDRAIMPQVQLYENVLTKDDPRLGELIDDGAAAGRRPRVPEYAHRCRQRSRPASGVLRARADRGCSGRRCGCRVTARQADSETADTPTLHLHGAPTRLFYRAPHRAPYGT